MPERLVNHLGGDISGTIKLEAPNGQIYDVGVANKMNRTVLHSGWEEFVDANQIQENNSLMFRYIGTNCFKITIFDSDGEERISCCAGMKHPTQVEKPSMYGADVLVSSSDGTTQSIDSDERYRTPVKTPAVTPSDELSAEYSPSESDSMELDAVPMRSKNYVLSRRCHITEEQMEEINALVAKVRPEIPVLVIMMKKSNVTAYPNLVITKEYARAYFPSSTQSVTLKVPEKSKGWLCKFVVRSYGCGHNLYLREFVHDNRIRVGDVCLFQPMAEAEATKFTVMVHLLHKAGRTDMPSNHGEDDPHEYGSIQSDQRKDSSKLKYILSSRCQLDEEDEARVDTLVVEIQPEIPLLVVKITKSNVNMKNAQPTLVISKGYGRAHFPNRKQTITLRLPGGKKKWHAIFHIRQDNGGYVLYGGWSEFVRDNHLSDKDICLLQPINKGEGRRFTVMVHLLLKERSSSRSMGDLVLCSNNGGSSMKDPSASCVKARSVDGTSDDSKRSGYVVLGTSTRLTVPQEKIVAKKVKAVKSEAPIYVATIDKSSCFAFDLSATVPDGHLPGGKHTLTLCQAGWKKTWCVEMSDKQMLPGRGWYELAVDNRLQAGDLCLLELMKNKSLAMAVHIIRSGQYCERHCKLVI